MHISFHGAAGEVTGSCNLLETGQQKILIDCGMFQGGEAEEQKNFAPFGFDPKELTAVIVTHAHLDHIGRLPLLIRAGYSGPIYATPATVQLAELILQDALQIMEEEYLRFGKPVLYDSTEVAGVIQQFKAVDYHQNVVVGHGLGKNEKTEFVFYDAGHIFGSAFVCLQSEGKKVVFSGDIGNTDVEIINNTEKLPDGLDAVICESTYGGRVHEVQTSKQREELIKQTVSDAWRRGGCLMIPSFALERTQQLLYILNDLVDRRQELPRVPIFLDSPLAIQATDVYRRFSRYYNPAAVKLLQADDDLFTFDGLIVCETKEESKKINHVPVPKIIIAGAGMLNGGRIVHHAMRYISDSSNTLLFIGYQAKGTLGRKILDGVSQVDIMGQRISVNCHIAAVGALSAHADQDKLLCWLGGCKIQPKQVYFNHGETDQAMVIADQADGKLKINAVVAKGGEKYIV